MRDLRQCTGLSIVDDRFEQRLACFPVGVVHAVDIDADRRCRAMRHDPACAAHIPAVAWYDHNASIASAVGLKVFSATKAREREYLGETIADWIRTHPEYEVFDRIVTQSSDAKFHYLAITLFYRVVTSHNT